VDVNFFSQSFLKEGEKTKKILTNGSAQKKLFFQGLSEATVQAA